MTTGPDKTDDQKFVPGQTYDFDPPVLTNCIAVGGDRWEERAFAKGWCIGYRPERNTYIFQGKPVDEKSEHFFHVEWGKGSVAKEISLPRL